MSRLLYPCAAVWLLAFGIYPGDGRAEKATLSPDWFVRYVAERTGPAELSDRVEERWRADASVAALHGDRVFLVTRTCPPAPLPDQPADLMQLLLQRIEATTFAMECREVRSGRILWKVECGKDRPHSPAWLDKFILVTFSHGPPRLPPPTPAPGAVTQPPATAPAPPQESIRLLDANTGRTIIEFGPRELKPADFRGRGFPAPDSGPVERYGLDRDLLATTYLSPGGPAAPVGSSPARWSFEDADLLLNIFGQGCIPRSGVATGLIPLLLTLDGDLFWVDGMRRVLCRTPFANDATNVWETPFLSLQHSATAHTGSQLVTFASRSSVISYDVQTGRPLWTHEWQQGTETYSRSLAVLTDGLLLLTDPQVPRPIIARQDPASGCTFVEGHTQLSLTKLDRQGKVVFKQELPVPGHYSAMLAGKNAVLICPNRNMGSAASEGEVICLAPVAPGQAGRQNPEPPPMRVQELMDAYERADARQRAAICADLTRLGDTRIVDRVFADLDDSTRDLQARLLNDPVLSEIRPKDREQHIRHIMKTKDHERAYYVQALGLLREPRAIPSLLPLLEFEYLRTEAHRAILSITDGDPLQNPDFLAWRGRRIPELRARFEAEQYAIEKGRIADELRLLQDPQLLDRLMETAEADEQGADSYLHQIALIGDKRAVPWLLDLYDSADPILRLNTSRAIDTVLGETSVQPDVARAWWQAHQHLYIPPQNGHQQRGP